MPSLHAIAVLVVTVAVFYLYTRPWIAMEMVSLLLLLSLLLMFYVFPYSAGGVRLTEVEVLQSFGHPALVAICALMILGRGLTMTGALEPSVRVLGRIWAANRGLGLLVTLMVGALASGFVNDTPVLVLMLPMLLGLAQRTGYPASKTLMPVNFAILAGGMLTSIGTSTNLLVLSIAVDLGMRPMGIFDFTSIAALSFAVALPYLWLVAPRLLPDTSDRAQAVQRLFEARIQVPADVGKLVGKPLLEFSRILGRPAPIVGILRQDQRLELTGTHRLEADDVLVLHDTPAGLREISASLRLDLFNREGVGRFVEADAPQVDFSLAEIVLGNDSDLVGSTLRTSRFAELHHVVVVGIQRGTEELQRFKGSLADTPLVAGDVFLVQGPVERIAALHKVPHLLVIDSNLHVARSPLAPWALLIMAGVIVAASTKALPIHVAAFIGVVLMLLTGCVKLHGVGRALSLEVVLLVASSIALGQSLVSTGAAGWIAEGVVAVVQQVPPAIQLGIFMTFAAILTNFVSNSAAAAVGTPIAIATANQLGSPLEPFVLAILFGANLSYATPMAYQTNLLIMNAGKYRFSDFLRVGVPLVLLMLVTLSTLLAWRYAL